MSELPREIPVQAEPEPPAWADVSTAVQEQKNWSTLDELKERNSRWWLHVYGVVLVTATLALSLLFLASLVSWSWHYIGPSKCHWLTPIQLDKIQSVLFSGGMGAILSSIVQKHLNKN